MALNFGGIGNINITSKKALRPWGIYKVKLTETEEKSGQGKKDPTSTWKALVLHFEGEEGTYQESIFYPKEGDDQRREVENTDSKGNKYTTVLPSSLDQLQCKMVHFIGVVGGKEAYETFAEKGAKLDCDSVMKLFKIILDKYVVGKEFYLKLTGRKEKKDGKETGNVYAMIPNIAAVNRTTQIAYCKENFASVAPEVLGFSTWEIGQKHEYEARKPTVMKEASTSAVAELVDSSKDKEVSEEDFDAMLNNL
jgi:hypothetical protein